MRTSARLALTSFAEGPLEVNMFAVTDRPGVSRNTEASMLAGIVTLTRLSRSGDQTLINHGQKNQRFMLNLYLAHLHHSLCTYIQALQDLSCH